MMDLAERMNRVADTPEASFSELVRIAALDPKRSCRFRNFEGLNFSGSNFAGFDFTGARLSGARFEGAQIFGAILDATQRGLPELRAAADYDKAAKAWRDQANKRKPHETASREWHTVWDKGEVPGWVDEYGTDSYGKWASFSHDGVAQVLRFCPPGRFLMGSPPEEQGRKNDEGPQQEIVFEHGFWLADTAVTQELYEAVMGDNEARFKAADNPEDSVSWEKAVWFTERLNELVPELACRLPSESEWEYACRAGSNTPFNPSIARNFDGQSVTVEEVNYDGDKPYGDAPKGESRQQTVAAKGGGFRPNNWGLWHMHGNLFEWCQDVWSGSHEGADPSGLARAPELGRPGRLCVLRGCSGLANAGSSRSAARSMLPSGTQDENIGFRLAAGQVMSSSAER